MNPTNITYFPNRTKLFLILLGGVALTATATWILVDQDVAPLMVRIAAWGGVPFFGTASLYLIFRLLRHRASVVLSDTGFTENSSMVSVGYVPWQDVASVEVFAIRNQKMVGVALKDHDKFLARLGMVRKALASVNTAMGFPLIVIPESSISVSAEDLVRQMDRMRSANGL